MRTVPYRTYLPYRTAILAFNYCTSLQINDLNSHILRRLQLSFTSAYKNSVQRAKSLGFLTQTAYQRTVPVPSQKKRTVPTYRTRTITKKAYRISIPYFLAKIEADRTVPTYRIVPYCHPCLLAFN